MNYYYSTYNKPYKYLPYQDNTILYYYYNIYEIDVCEAIKGELKNKLLKIHISENVEIDEDKTYKLYLAQYENTPCSLVNIKQGISEVK